MKSIYILLTKSDTYISKIIGLTTSDTYTHASISFEMSLKPMYSFSRKFVDSPLPAGLRIEPLDKGFFKKYRYIPCALYELKVSDDVYQSAKTEVEYMMTQSSYYKFNIIGLLLCKMNIEYNRKNHYFCSEFVSEILTKSNALKLPKPPSLMRPNDYTKLPSLFCRYEGNLNILINNMEAQMKQLHHTSSL